MLETTQGIVLHYNRYNDDTAIVDIFTLSRGSVSFLVRDRRHQRKSNIRATLLRPLNIVELVFEFRPSASLHKIQELHIAHCYTSLPYDPIKETVALFLSEFLHNVLRNEVKNENLFHYILYSFQWFDTTSEGLANFHVAFLTRLTYYLGFWPNIDKKNKLPFFDLKDSIATDTEPSHNFFIKGEEVAMMPKLLRMNVRNMHRFLLTRQQRNRILDVLTLYYRLHVPEFRDLRSLAVLREVLA
ncbi:MAG: DNA repair protein RecO [Bacteroidaceae bacterium]|nr:DNA repair protein RecO [Bacteroidaceae bacterium]